MRRFLLHLGLCVAAAIAPAGSAPAQANPAPKRILQLQLRGDLDNARLCADLTARLKSASAEGAGLIILELDGNRWRTDIVASMCRAVQTSTLPVAVYLCDQRDHRVGTGAALVGLSGASCFIEARTEIVSEPADDRRALAPKETNWEEVEQSLLGAAGEGQRTRGADARLPAFLLKPDSVMWAIEPGAGEPMLLSPAPPQSTGAGSSQFAARIAEHAGGNGAAAEGAVTIRIRPDIALGLRLVKASVARAGEIIAAEGAVARPLVNDTLTSGLESAARDLKRAMERADSASEQAEHTLEVRVPDQRQNTDSLYRDAGKSALEQTGRATSSLDEAQRLMRDYPELARTPAFGQTDIGHDADDFENEWRRAVQRRRDKIARLEVKARGYSTR